MYKSKIKFTHVDGPFGDATSGYTVEFPKAMTVLEFVSYITDDYSVHSCDTWGFIAIARFGERIFLSYDKGSNFVLSASLFEEIKDKEIIYIRGEGGWSRMDYILTLEED